MTFIYDFSFEDQYIQNIISQALLDSQLQLYFIDRHMYKLNPKTLSLTIFAPTSVFAGYETPTNKLNAFLMIVPLLFFSKLKRTYRKYKTH